MIGIFDYEEAIGIFDYEEALLEWEVCGPAVPDMF